MARQPKNPDRSKWDHVPWHEHLECTTCQRTFWGEKAWNDHYPCKGSTWTEEPGEFFRVERKGKSPVMFYQYNGGVFVTLDEKAEFVKMNEKARAAREGRDKNKDE